MSETYIIYAPNGVGVEVNKQTNEIYFSTGTKEAGKYNKKHSDIYFKSYKARESSPYKSYKPIYLDPTLKTGQSSTYLEFKAWQELYLKEPVKGSIAPWTKQEKAYYESLKTKRERYKYLVIRSGLRSSVIDIPYEAYAGVDENGKLINKEYEYLYAEVEANRGLAHLSDGYLAMGEWELAAGILGDINGFAKYGRLHGFKARLRQVKFLTLQLSGGGKKAYGRDISGAFINYADKSESGFDGIHINKLRALQIKEFAKNPPYDKYGMLPYLDELIGVDWVMDYNNYRFIYDGSGDAIGALYDDVKQGKLKDPRDKDSTKESRLEFEQEAINYRENLKTDYSLEVSNDTPEQSANIWLDNMLLEAKIKAITPPQGYPNAPTYYTPEKLELIYQKGYLDKKLNPTIPAIYRENFPEYLRKEIEDYARKHNIK